MSLSNVINTADKYSPAKQESYRIRKHIVGALNFIINCFSIACFIAGNTLIDLALNSSNFKQFKTKIQFFLSFDLGLRQWKTFL
jgi:hypothetical protein